MGNLKVSTTDDVIHKRASILFFGPPKSGKTGLLDSLKLTGPDSEVVYIAADPGQMRLRKRKFRVLEPNSGQGIDKEFLQDCYEFCKQGVANGTIKYICVDGADAIGNVLLRTLLSTAKDPRKAYGEMAEIMEEWLLKMRDLKGATYIVITHMSSNKLDNDVLEFVPTFPGKQINERVNGWFDIIGCVRPVMTGETTSQTFIQFNPLKDPRYKVGDRSGVLSDYEAPDLGAILEKIHDAGLVTEGVAEKYIPPRSDEDMQVLFTLARSKNLSIEQVKNMCAAIAEGRGPRFTTDEELEELKNQISLK